MGRSRHQDFGALAYIQGTPICGIFLFKCRSLATCLEGDALSTDRRELGAEVCSAEVQAAPEDEDAYKMIWGLGPG